MIAENMHRVEDNTAPEVNKSIERCTEIYLTFYRENRHLIPQRLRELDNEWDVERTLETLSSSLTLGGLTMAILGRKRWLLLPVAVQAFFLQHSLQGWCPPLGILRRLGFRTVQEIDIERNALLDLMADGDLDEAETEPAMTPPEQDGPVNEDVEAEDLIRSEEPT